jgi:hypothetical protein
MKYEPTLDDLVAKMCKAEHWASERAGIGWGFEIPQPKDRKQKVYAVIFEDNHEELVRYTSMIGPADKIDNQRSKMALELNAKMPHGCLAIEGGHLIVTATRPMKTTTPETSAAVVKYLAKQADTYERLIFASDQH